MGIEELIAAEVEATERNPDAPIRAETKVTRGHNRTKTLQVRLNDEEYAALQTLAEQRGVPASTLARDLLMSRMTETPTTTQAVIARMRSDLEALASSVA